MNGLVLLNKPKGKTSFWAASALKRIYNTKRIGHTGTLDPLATGVLPILVGRATRLSQYILGADKRYTATVLFGVKTDTLDITGEVLSKTECDVKREDLEQVLPRFTGKINQIPPMFSAIKKQGVRLYELARKGETVEREPREIEIKQIKIIEKKEKNVFLLDVICSKGTYIRSLADDIGDALGVGATLTDLVRTETAGFRIEECFSLEEISQNSEKTLYSADKAIPHFPSVKVTANQKTRFLHGGELSIERLKDFDFGEGIYKVYFEDEFLGLGEVDNSARLLKVKCILME